MATLNAYSQRFGALLFTQYPDWRKLAEVDESGSFTVTVPSPNANATYPLRVSTDDDEVTVGFDYFHDHFFLQDEERDFECALEFIADLLAERIVVVVFMEGDRWCASQCGTIDGAFPSPNAGQRRITRSWLGNLDTELVG